MSSSIIVSGTPHVRSKESIQSIMRDVVIALIPASVMGIYYFGIKALMLIAISIVSSVVFEWGYEKILKKPVTVSDFSAVLTGLLLALNLPVTASWWVPVVGSFVAIILGKQFYGGLGQNFINPALIGRAFLVAAYPTQTTGGAFAAGRMVVDASTYATPLAEQESLNTGYELVAVRINPTPAFCYAVRHLCKMFVFTLQINVTMRHFIQQMTLQCLCLQQQLLYVK